MRTRRRAAAVAAAGALAAGLAMTSATGAGARPDGGVPVPFRDGFSDLPLADHWQDGEDRGGWRAQFDGWGTTAVVREDGRAALAQRPREAAEPARTDASLVTTTRVFGDLDLAVTLRTAEQLRTPTPNPWEVAWVLWHYSDNTHFYYLALKPNGWELGKEDPAYPGAQRFLAAGAAPAFPVGPWYEVRVQHRDDTSRVWVDGEHLVTFRDTERPYRRGAVGLYTEDADVRFRDVSVVGR